MSSFTDVLDYECVGRGIYKTRIPFRFYLNDDKTGDYVDVPSAFISNGASIPQPLQRLFGWQPIDPRWAQASFLHDGLVGETGITLTIENDDADIQRYAGWSEAATWFDSALRVKREQCVECPSLNRHLFVLGVRLWGMVR